MNDEQVERLLHELAATRASFDASRKSFDTAIKTVKWSRRNTIIQYGLLLVVFLMLISGLKYYWNDRQKSCQSLDDNAAAIGVALAEVSGASTATFEEYMTIYRGEELSC